MTEQRILIVEDERLVASSLKRCLTDWGYQVPSVVASGEEAIEAAEHTNPDAVLMDILLEGDMDGIEAASRIREAYDIPVIFLTAYAEDTFLARAKVTEPHGYLIKPCSENELRSTVEMALYKARMERRLRESEERFRILYEDAPLGYQSLDAEGRIREVNREWLRMLGYDRSEAVGADFAEFMAPHEQDAFRERFARFLSEGEAHGIEWELVRKDGSHITAAFDGTVSRRSDGTVRSVQCILHDVTEKKRIQNAIIRAKREWEQTFDSVSDLIALVDADYRIVRLNKAMAARMGLTPQEAVGRRCYEAVHNLDAPPAFCPHATLIETGRTQSVEIEDEWLPGTFLISLFPLIDESGNVRGSVHAARDITEMKKARQVLDRTQRLEAIAELARGVSHHFNNLLQVILAGAEVGLMNLDMDEIDDAKGAFRQITEGCRFGSHIVRRLHDFTRSMSDNKRATAEVFDLSKTVEQALELAEPTWSVSSGREDGGVTISSDLAPRCMVEGAEHELFDVAGTLIKNAVEALKGAGRVRVSVAAGDESVVLRVADTGVGIAPDDLDRVFHPFWTTKGPQALGLRLPCALGIVRRHGGEITVESEPGKGSIFTVRLPRASERGRTSTEGPTEPAERFRILVVDRVEAVANVIAGGLERAGHSVSTAGASESALKLLQSESFDAVICDQGLPGVNGWLFCERLKEFCPAQGWSRPIVIMMSGWGRPQGEFAPAAAGIDRIVAKPIDVAEIDRILRDLARQSSGRSGPDSC